MVWKPKFALIVAFKLICVVGSGVSYLPLDNTTQIIYGLPVRPVRWSVKHSNTMVSTPVTSSFGSVDRCQVVLEKEIGIHKGCPPTEAQNDLKSSW